MFGRPVPQFNLKGRVKLHTRLGGCVSLILMSVVLIFATLKFFHLWTKQNPNLYSYERSLIELDDQRINLNEKNFRIAFALESVYEPHQLLNDPDYVKWIFRVY